MVKSKKLIMIGIAGVCAIALAIVGICGCQSQTSSTSSSTQSSSFQASDLQCLTDIHCHLDGAISVSSAQQIGKTLGIPVSDDYETVKNALRVSEDCSDLNEFLEKFEFPNTLLQTQESIYMAVRNLLYEQSEQGVMYSEIRFAPQKSTEKGLTQDQAVAAAIEALETSNVKCCLTLCCMRGDDTHAANMETVEVAKKYLGKGVGSVDLAGAEALYPTKDFSAEFARAKELGVPFTIHAGEADGPESVKAALSFGAKRIGHGVRSMEDPELVQRLADEKITLEVCPTSNVCTALYKNISEHPIKKLIDAGCKVTINTDDPSVEGCYITMEYQKVIDTFNLSKEEVKTCIMNAVDAAFCDDATKAELRTKVNNEFAKL